MTVIALTNAYQEIAADVAALTLVQVPDNLYPQASSAEFLASASAPSEDDGGVQLTQGETAVGDALIAIGASGALYARRYLVDHPVNVFVQ